MTAADELAKLLPTLITLSTVVSILGVVLWFLSRRHKGEEADEEPEEDFDKEMERLRKKVIHK